MTRTKGRSLSLTVLLLVSVLNCIAQEEETAKPAMAPAVPFTYQGRLTVGGTLANGSFDFVVRVYREAEGGDPESETSIDSVQVTFGTFTVPLEFDTIFFQRLDTAYLDIWVRPAGEGEYTQLTPRQQIGSTPYAKVADNSKEANALACANCVTNLHIVSVAGSKVTGSVANATNAVNAQTAQNTVNAVDLTSDQTVNGEKRFNGLLIGNGGFAGDGSGLTNVSGTLKWNVVTGTSVPASPNNAYMTTNTGQTVITLPASANEGDVIKIRAQGDGGFRISQLSGQQILASNIPNNTFAYFTPRESNRNWFSITSSADGKKLAAVVLNGQIYTSADSGVTWTARQSNRSWESITSSADGSKLAAVVDVGQIYTSTDSGVTWTPRETNRQWESITSSADGTKLAAVVVGGQIFTSTDSGHNWTEYESDRQWRSIASSADGSKLAATVNGGRIFITTSTTTLGAAGYLTGGQNSAIELQYIGDGKFIPISFVGAVRGY